jgi:large subunit ribosomal protein L17
MVHRVAAKKLSRDSAARSSLLKNLASSAILHEKIVTTLPKAKAVKPFLEKLITRSKEDSILARRYLLAKLGTDRATRKLLEVVGPAFRQRPGGYTRITKLPPRMGDNAPMAILEFVENVSEVATKKKLATPETQSKKETRKKATTAARNKREVRKPTKNKQKDNKTTTKSKEGK